MPKATTYLKNRCLWLHGWLGGSLGVLLFVIAFSGAMSIFAERLLHPLANPGSTTTNISAADWQSLIGEARQLVGQSTFDELSVKTPGGRHDPFISFLFTDASSQPTEAVEVLYSPGDAYFLAPRSGKEAALAEQQVTGFSQVLRHVHAKLLLPNGIAPPVLAVLAMAMFLLASSGLVLQPSMLREMFTLPNLRNPLTLLRSLHKLLAAWVIVFLLFMSYTAVFFTVVLDYLILPVAAATYDLDVEALLADFQPEPAPVGVTAPAAATFSRVADAIVDATDSSGGHVKALEFTSLESPEAVLTVETSKPDMNCASIFDYMLLTGQRLDRHCAIQGASPALAAFLNSIVELHFTSIGPSALGWVWFAFGIATAITAWAGIGLYARKRVRTAATERDKLFYERLARGFDGACGSVLVLTFALINADILLGDTYWLSRSAVFSAILVAGVIICACVAVVSSVRALKVQQAFSLTAALSFAAPASYLGKVALTGAEPTVDTTLIGACILLWSLATVFYLLGREAGKYELSANTMNSRHASTARTE